MRMWWPSSWTGKRLRMRMGHCVASYVPEAIAGRCYLFHVEHEGDAATVMVQWDGAITEAAGPAQ